MNAIKTRKFYSVGTVNDMDDEMGCTVTFGTYEKAAEYRAWALTQGLMYVSQIWS